MGSVELTQLEILLLNTGKHIYNAPLTAQGALWTLDLVDIMGNEPLAQKPMVTIRACPKTPLVLAREVAQTIILSARRGGILALGSACAAGTTSPVTLAGTLLMQNAEFLFELVLAQLARPGAPVDYQVASTVADLRTGLTVGGAVERTLIAAGSMAMAERYDLPFSANYSVDSPTIDVHNGLQKMLDIAYRTAIGINFVRNAGNLDNGRTMSCEQLVIDHEIAQMVQRFWQGIRVDEEALAVDVIREVGPGGTFLTHEHTLKHCRSGEHYLTPLLYRSDTGRPTLLEWAHERVEEILQTHVYKPPGEKAEELRRYVAKERKWMQNAG